MACSPLGIPNWSGLHQEHCVGSAPSVTQMEASAAAAAVKEADDCFGLLDTITSAAATTLEALISLRFETINDCLFLLFILEHFFPVF